MLIRLDEDSFAALEAAWAGQCQDLGEDFAEYAAPSIEHARGIAREPANDRYGIFCLRDRENGDDVCILHGNVARLPRTNGLTLRIVWVLLAPRFDFEDVSSERFARIVANLIVDAMQLSRELGSHHIKLHLGNAVDRNYFAAVAATLATTKAVQEASIRGAWMHITM
jgi:hypothetical protein